MMSLLHTDQFELCVWLCFTGCSSTPLLVPGAAAQRRLPGGWRGGELAERSPARSRQTPQPTNTQQAAGTQTLAHHAATHPVQTQHSFTLLLLVSKVQSIFIVLYKEIGLQPGLIKNTQNPKH